MKMEKRDHEPGTIALGVTRRLAYMGLGTIYFSYFLLEGPCSSFSTSSVRMW